MIASLLPIERKVEITTVEQIIDRAALRRVGSVMCSVLVCGCGEVARFTATHSFTDSFGPIDKINNDIQQSGWVEDNQKTHDWCPTCKHTAKKIPVQRSARIPRFSVLDDAVFAMEAGML